MRVRGAVERLSEERTRQGRLLEVDGLTGLLFISARRRRILLDDPESYWPTEPGSEAGFAFPEVVKRLAAVDTPKAPRVLIGFIHT